MWEKPQNIEQDDWARLTDAWEARKSAVYERFYKFDPALPLERIDGIMAGLLSVYYQVEKNDHEGAAFSLKLRDEFHKGMWVEGQIAALERDYPAMRQKAQVRYMDEIVAGSAADNAMGGIVKSFIDITRSVCTERFGKPYGKTAQGLRNGILERRCWSEVMADYEQKYETYRAALQSGAAVEEPEIYRQ